MKKNAKLQQTYALILTHNLECARYRDRSIGKFRLQELELILGMLHLVKGGLLEEMSYDVKPLLPRLLGPVGVLVPGLALSRKGGLEILFCL